MPVKSNRAARGSGRSGCPLGSLTLGASHERSWLACSLLSICSPDAVNDFFKCPCFVRMNSLSAGDLPLAVVAGEGDIPGPEFLVHDRDIGHQAATARRRRVTAEPEKGRSRHDHLDSALEVLSGPALMVNVGRRAQFAVTAADLIELVVPPTDDSVGNERRERQRTGPDTYLSYGLSRETKPFM